MSNIICKWCRSPCACEITSAWAYIILCIKFKIGDKHKQSGGEMIKILFDRHFDVWYTINENGGENEK